MLLVELIELFGIDTLSLALTFTLSQHLDLKGLLMGVLKHHTLELESIAI